jgi:arylsulfatase A-like enzyme
MPSFLPLDLTRRSFLKMAIAAAAETAPTGMQAVVKSRRPNILLILADDMGFSDIGCYGSEIDTPNIDGIAQRGLRFTQFYNNARCCPTRASLLTGLYNHQTGIGLMTADLHLPSYQGELNSECVTMAEVLKPAGYHTLMCGKWHVAHDDPEYLSDKRDWPLQRGFERYFGTIAGAGSYYDPYTLTQDNELIEPDEKEFYYTDAIARHASGLIREYAKKAEPYFMYAAFTAPHWPLHAQPEDIAKYRERYKGGWDRVREQRHERQIAMGIVDAKWPLTPRDADVPAWADAQNKEWEAERMAVYAAQIDRLDRGIGKLLEAVRESGKEEDTLIFFLSDNGGCAEELTSEWKLPYIPAKTRDGHPVRLGNDPQVMPGPEDTYQSYGKPWANASNTPFRLYKHWIHEGGIATPLIACWPRAIHRHNTLTPQTGHIMDFMATVADVGEASYPTTYHGNAILPMEGLSLRPILEGRQRKEHDEICWEHMGNRAIRQRNWKLVSRYPDRWELYDMEADRTEMQNLAEAQPERAAAMKSRWEAWADRCHVVPESDILRRQRTKAG